MDAWQRADIDELTGLMTRDVVITMPPDPLRFDGPAAVVASLVSIAPDGRLERMAANALINGRRCVPTTNCADVAELFDDVRTLAGRTGRSAAVALAQTSVVWFA